MQWVTLKYRMAHSSATYLEELIENVLMLVGGTAGVVKYVNKPCTVSKPECLEQSVCRY